MIGHRSVIAAVATLVVASCGLGTQAPTALITASAPTPTATTVSAAPSPPIAATTTASPTLTPTPIASSTPSAVPLAPSGATFKITYSDINNKMTVTWTGPRAKGTEIRVYGVTACIAMPPSPSEGAEGPCLVEHTPLPESVRKLIAKAAASTGKVSWTWPNWEDIGSSVAESPDGTAYEAIVIAAYNDAGHSKFIIVDAGNWCGDCTY